MTLTLILSNVPTELLDAMNDTIKRTSERAIGKQIETTNDFEIDFLRLPDIGQRQILMAILTAYAFTETVDEVISRGIDYEERFRDNDSPSAS